ncbi:prolipoprotein diacylglyceryl transferase [Escherichia coli]|uniref:Prolipoprotein diacylglyceryl transferase n=1 Tax=Escherichia coli TaxID=562 RepID=A0A377CXR9_ECOLX|nr:prolipoprotein diacylglyceryl transferase [Escherichia coli]
MTSSYLHFPEFDPVIFSIGPVALHWYGLMYLVGFIFAMWLATRRANRPGSGWTKNEVETYSMRASSASSSGDVLVMFCSTISRSLWPIRCICSVSGTAACLSTAA